MNAKDIIKNIGFGVVDALRASERFLGIEGSASKNADIQPEYLATVKIAERLTDANHVVSLEASMEALKDDVRWLAKTGSAMSWSEFKENNKKIDNSLSNYFFGKKRIDIFVVDSGNNYCSLLMVEVKLGVGNVSGVINDLNRLSDLLFMCEEVNILSKHNVYCAVVFHVMLDGSGEAGLVERSSNALSSIKDRLLNLSSDHKWFKYWVGRLQSAQIVTDIQGHDEVHDDGTIEGVFGKYGFAFVPIVALFGNCDDILQIDFQK